MRTCEYTHTCPFFAADVGYSPDLNDTMRAKYCLGEKEKCARYLAAQAIGSDKVPGDMLPTDELRLQEVLG